MRLPQPKYWLWMMSGAMIRSISSRVLVRSQVGITPSVSPLCGSVSISGIGMKGAFAGSNQRASLEGGGATGAAAAGIAGRLMVSLMHWVPHQSARGGSTMLQNVGHGMMIRYAAQ